MVRIFFVIVSLNIGLFATAETLLVEKKKFDVGTYVTEYGETIENVVFGYETFGELNADRSNAILVPHFFSGTSHIAGKYDENDKAVGYWDNLIGPGKAVDTNKFFVIGVDSLSNINALQKNVYTTGPASINPDTNKPYGMRFPRLTAVDLVRVQKSLLDSLGVKKLYVSMGASGGAVQSMQWSATYPDSVGRVIAIVPPGLKIPEFESAMMELWLDPIKLDKNWKGGEYYESEFPKGGLVSSLKLMTLNGTGYRFAREKFPSTTLDPCDPKKDHCLQTERNFINFMTKRAEGKVDGIDPNSVITMVDTYQTFDITNDIGKIKAEFLFILCQDDRIFNPNDALNSISLLKVAKPNTKVHYFSSDIGHLGAIRDVDRFESSIRSFLND